MLIGSHKFVQVGQSLRIWFHFEILLFAFQAEKSPHFNQIEISLKLKIPSSVVDRKLNPFSKGIHLLYTYLKFMNATLRMEAVYISETFVNH